MEKNSRKEKRVKEALVKEVQKEKADREWQYDRILFETNIDSIVTIGLDGLITDANLATEKVTGLPREKIIGTYFSGICTNPEKASAGYKQVSDFGKLIDYELCVKHADGLSIPVLCNAAMYKDNEGQTIGMLVVAKDISAIKKHENELINLKNNLEQKTAELVNANSELAFENREKDRRAADLIVANKELLFQNEEKDKRAAELIIADKELTFQSEEKRKQAKRTDVLKEQNIELEIQKKLLAEASQHKSSFLSNMSHEIRTPINAIVGFTELALKTDLTPKQHNYLSKIKTSSHTLLGLINDLLDLSKIEAGRMELEITTINLKEVLQNVVSQVSTKIQEKELELQVFIEEDVPIILNGDPLRLEQILLNLASNAVKFTDEGKIIIRVELLEYDEVIVLLQFSVKDTGIGLTKEQIKDLFQTFTQADTSTTRKYGGTGLGLNISQKLVNLMDGDIWVESELGTGSTFFFTIKMNVADTERFRQYKKSFEKWGMKALVVDDNINSREIIGSMLADMSFIVTLCASGEEAIAILKKTKDENRFDIVIMDWKMSGLDGVEATKRIKTLFSSGKAPAIILITAYSSEGVQVKVEQNGLMEVVLYKPVNPSLLFNTIIHVCGKDGLEQMSSFSEGKNSAKYLPQLCGIRVLLVEDNEINREVAQEILQEAGMAVTIANNGLEAVDKVKTGTYDIVLMDIQMPVMDGYDATREIRKNPVFAELPVIAMTANALLSDQKKCIQAGMNDHVAKPIDTNHLFQKIAHWINKDKGAILEAEPLGVPAAGPSANEASADNSEKIPNLVGIDAQAGLNRLGGNQKLYRKLLGKFNTNHMNAITEFRHALDHGDPKAAVMIVHTLKGASGSLGIQDVYLSSSALEAELRADRLDSAELFIERLEQALEQALASISLLGKIPGAVKSSNPGGADVSQLNPILRKLKNLLLDKNLDAVDCVEEIVIQAKSTALADITENMKDYVDQYDFDVALGILDEILDHIRQELQDE